MKYDVKGMSCAACQSHVEKAVNSLDGVTSCSVSLLTNSMVVEGTVSSQEVIKAVEKAGYQASVQGQKQERKTQDHSMTIRLICSIVVLILLMYISMGHKMWNWPLPYFLHNPISRSIVEMLLASIVMIIHQRFFINGFKGVIHKSMNMDTLVSLGSLSSYIYSTYLVLKMPLVDIQEAMVLSHDLYFESAAMILVLISVGKLLEEKSKGKTTTAIQALMNLKPKTALKLIDNKEVEVDIEQIQVGDTFILKPGYQVPVDGIVLSGTSSIDESSLTGESIPVDKQKDDKVYAATINQAGFIQCQATKVGEDTTLSQIIQMVQEASSSKAPIARIADKVSAIFVPCVITIAIITFIGWMMNTKDVGYSLERAISVLVISCPCSLGLATPVAIMVGNGVGAKHNILFKNSTALEQTGKTNIVALDKTGTITKGQPVVRMIQSFNNYTNEQVLSCASSLEALSEHPLAKAIVQKGKEQQVELLEVADFESLTGNGIKGRMNHHNVLIGSVSFIQQFIRIDDFNDISKLGMTPVVVCCDEQCIGVIGIEDEIKEDALEAIEQLHKMKCKVVMLTGDNELCAKAIAKQVNIDEVYYQLLPDQKAKIVQNLQKEGNVLMVGDGINDAVSLSQADIGMAMGQGVDIAMDAADVICVRSKLLDVCTAIQLSRYTLTNIYENLFWAFFYNILGIPLAAGLFSIRLNPMIAAAMMSVSSFCVVSNALRLNYKKVGFEKENKTMIKTLKIEGMMCPHCENSVKKALESVTGVTQVEVSFKTGQAIVTMENEVNNEVLKKVVEDKDYKVISIQ